MPRKSYGYPRDARFPRASRSNRSSLTRRGLLGAAALIGGASIADLLHKPGKRSAATVGDPSTGTRVTTAGETKSAGRPRAVTGSTGAKPHPGSSHPPATTHSHAPEHHGSGRGKQPTSRHPEAHGRSHSTHHTAKVEHVKLPPAKVKVRSHPVYSIDELMHDVPKHAIALTVDDGPDPEWTPKVLRLLDKHRMQASFCVVGIHADSYPKLVRDVARAGHVIVNHTYTHVQPFNHQSEKRIVAEITRTQRAIEKATKNTPELFRAPGGAWSPFIFRAIAAYGLTPLDWDIDPDDWEMPGTRKIERAMLKGRPGDIVLCHDGGGNRSETVRALRKVLPAWKHRGYTTIPLVVPASAKRSSPPPSHSPKSPSPSSSPSQSTSTSPSP